MNTPGVLRTCRFVLCMLVVGMGLLWFSTSAFGEGEEKCEVAIYPCDPDRGYIWNGECYDDDGCYFTLEECCEI
jgi:hypothetical protein